MIVRELVYPDSIVVVGGSNDMSKPGGTVLRNIINGGYTGRLLVVNPRERLVQGIIAYHDADSLPDVECAILAIPAMKITGTVETLAVEKKTKAFIVLSAGFSETGDEGRVLEQKLADTVNRVKGTLIGPNCTGVLFPRYMGSFAEPVPELNPQGIDFAAASGAAAVFTLERAIALGLKFSGIIAVGNSAQTSVEDVVQYWDESFNESGSRVKLLYLEQIKKPEILIRHCSSLIAKGCRIAAIKAGSSEAGSRAAMSHTGALAGPDMAVDALFRKCGITRCYSREELVYTAGVMCHRRLEGANIAVVTHAGGPGVMAADALSECGIRVPHIHGAEADRLKSGLYHGSSTANPIDFIGTGTALQLGMILDFVDNQCDNIDGSVVIFGSPGLFDVTAVYELLDEKMKTCRKPVFPVLPSTITASDAIENFKSKGRIFFPDEVMLARALAGVYYTVRPFTEQAVQRVDTDAIRRIIDSSDDGYLAPDKACQLLDAAFIPRVKEMQVHDLRGAEDAAVTLGFPLAMKAAVPLHKSDSGGVRLNLSSAEDVRRAYDELMQIRGAAGIIMQQMTSGIELYAGGKFETGFGHLVLCGMGGLLVEVLKDVSAAIAPAGMDEALNMIRRLKSYEIIKGARGETGVNENKYAEIITALSALLCAAPEIHEIDINPLIGRGDTIKSVDCRVLIKKPELNNL